MKKVSKILVLLILFILNVVNIRALSDEQIEEIKSGELELTYDLMGAVGDGVTNDYAAIQATHDLANRIYLDEGIMVTVYGNSDKTYYISVAAKPIKIITNVDWRNCNFIFDDYVDENNDGENDVSTGLTVFYITSNMSTEMELKKGSKNVFLVEIAEQLNALNFKINNNVEDYSPIVDALKSNNTYETNSIIKKDFDNSRYWGLNIIAEEPYRYLRNGGQHGSAGDLQRETILIDTLTGELLTDLNWDYNSFSRVEVFPIRNEQIEIKNGNFLTKTNNVVYKSDGTITTYTYRNIKVQYSGNVSINNVKHKIDENAHLNENEYQSRPSGNMYAGFVVTNGAALVWLKDMYLSPHMYVPGGSAPYDLRFDYSTYIYVDNASYFCDTVDSECYSEYMLNNTRWGVMSSNYIKNLYIKNSELNRVDSHKGVTNLYVEDSTVGVKGFTLTGKGTAYVKNTIIDGASNIIALRSDYGSTYEGNIVLKDIIFKPANTSLISIINARNDQSHYYGYLSTFPNVFIDGLSIKDEDKTNISQMDLIYLPNQMENSEDNKRYYFEGNVYAKNIFTDEKELQLFPSNFTESNYLISTYGGNNAVSIYLDSNIKKDSSLLSLSNGKFKLSSSIEQPFDLVDLYFENMLNEEILSTSIPEFRLPNILFDNLNNVLIEKSSKATVEDLFNTTKNNATLSIYSSNNELIYSKNKTNSNKALSTGQYVKYYDINNGVMTHKISVVGDVNGDGKINSADLLRVRQHLLNINLLKNEYFESSDINRDSKVNSADLLRIRQHLLGTNIIG